MKDPEFDSEAWKPFTFARNFILDRQEMQMSSPLALVIVAFQLLLPLFALLFIETSLLPPEDSSPVPLAPPLSLPGLPAVAVTWQGKPKLKNHPKCGITTGGQVNTSRALNRNFFFSCPILLGGMLVEMQNPSKLVSNITNSPSSCGFSARLCPNRKP